MNLEAQEAPLYFEVVTAQKSNGVLFNKARVGSATFFPKADHYVLRLWMNHNVPYYLVKIRGRELRYSIFAGRDFDSETAQWRFRRRVGCAFIADDIKTHLELNFLLPSISLYMNLFPDT